MRTMLWMTISECDEIKVRSVPTMKISKSTWSRNHTPQAIPRPHVVLLVATALYAYELILKMESEVIPNIAAFILAVLLAYPISNIW